MSLRCRPVESDEELEAFAQHLARSFALPPRASPEVVRSLPRDGVRVGVLDDEVVAGFFLHDMGQYFGGRRVGSGGVGSVSTDPKVRGRGVASSLMRAALEELYERGTPLSTLYPAAQGLYRSLGWEQAGTWTRYRLPIANLAFRERSLAVTEVKLDDDTAVEVIEDLYAARARVTPGHLDRSAAMWTRVRVPPEAEVACYVVEGDQGPEGYLIYSLQRGEGFQYDVAARDLVAQTPRALRRLLSLVADHRSLGRDLLWAGGPTDPVLLATDDQAHGVVDHWRWMLRLVDVRKALAARGYAPGVRGEVHLEILDDVLPQNRGRLVLEVQDGRAEVKDGGRGDVRVPVGALAALYSGDASAHVLARAGRLQSDDDDACLLAALFAGPAPWTPDFF
jgi:predicted acetyltransferase